MEGGVMAKIRTPQEQADIEQFSKWFACGTLIFIIILAAIFATWFVNMFLGGF
jgi:hypothetical protein